LRVLYLVVLSILFTSINCFGLPKIAPNESILDSFEQDFQKFSVDNYGIVTKIKREKDSIGDISVIGEGYSTVFGRDNLKSHGLRYIRVEKKGIFLVQHFDFIGATESDIISIFGPAKSKTANTIAYEDEINWLFINFKIKNGTVDSWSIGYEP